MTADRVSGDLLAQLRLGRLADLADLALTPGLKRTSGRRISAARDLALEHDPLPSELVEPRYGRQQRLRVRMVRSGENVLGRPDLHHPPEIQHGDPVGEVVHDAEVVADEQIRDVLVALEVREQVEDRRLDRDVQRRGRLVAHDDPRVAGECSRDRHPLLEAARQLRRPHRQVALGQPHRADQLEQPLGQLLAMVAAELRQRPGDQPAHGVAAVQRGVGILEDDLERLLLGQRAPVRERRERLSVELDDAAGVGGGEPDDDAGQRRLSAPGLADEAERLARQDLDVDILQSADVMAGLMERLGDAAGADHRSVAVAVRGELAGGRVVCGDGPRQRLGALVEVTPRAAAAAELVDRWMFGAAAVLNEAATVGEDAALDLVTGLRRKPGDRVEPAAPAPGVAAGDASEQPNRVGVPGVLEDAQCRSLLDELAGVQHADAVAHLRDHRQVVADEQQRRAGLAAQVPDQLEHLGLDGSVERGGRLVEDQQRRLGGERHRDHGPLQHAARQLVRVALHHVAGIGDLDLRQDLLGALERLLSRNPGELVDLGDLTADVDRRVECLAGLLVDHRDLAGPELAELLVVQRQDVAAVDRDRAGAHPSVARQVAHDRQRHRRLSGPRLAHEPVGLAARDVEADVAQHPLVLAPHAVGDIHPVDGEGIVGHDSNACSTELATMFTPTTSVAIASASKNTSHQ